MLHRSLISVGLGAMLFASATSGSGQGVIAGDDLAYTLEGYEGSALKQVLDDRALLIDKHPDGKMISRVIVVNLPVFDRSAHFLQHLNALHRTTRAYVIEREVLLRPGDMWNPDRVQETRRRLREPLFTSLVVLAPVVSSKSGHVDLLVVTRDVWSLRTNSVFEFQEGTLTRLSLSLSENNVLGYRKQAAWVFDMDQGKYGLGPQYVDKNILGSRLELTTISQLLFSREEDRVEGSSSSTSLAFPLWSLATRYGASIEASHFVGVRRSFLGRDLRPYDNPDTDVVEALPQHYRYRSFALETTGVKQAGDDVKHRVRLGHTLQILRPSFLQDWPGTAVDRTAFERDIFPRSERVSALFAQYSLFTPRFTIFRNLDNYDLAEDVRTGPNLVGRLSLALEPLGSQFTFAQPSLTAGWTARYAGDGFVDILTSYSARVQSSHWIDNSITAKVEAATPTFGRVGRVSAHMASSAFLRETNNRFFELGGDSGLRGYRLGAFAGRRSFIGNVEFRTPPRPIWFARVGGLLFYDVGHAADRVSDLHLHHDVGLGFRMGTPQFQSVLFRLDWAMPLTGATRGFPGRFSAGVSQVF